MDIFKESFIIFQNFPKNVIKDLYKCERGGGWAKTALSPTFIAVTLKINIHRPNFS